MSLRKCLVFVKVILLLLSFKLPAQTRVENLQQFLTGNPVSTYRIQFEKEVNEFYRLNGYQLCWVNSEFNRRSLQQFILHAEELGLIPADYQPQQLSSSESDLVAKPTKKDSLITELRFADAAIHFIHDVLMGNSPEPVSYNGLQYSPDCFNIGGLLHSYTIGEKFAYVLSDLEQKETAYLSVKKQLNAFLQQTRVPEFKDVLVKSVKLNNSNQPLIQRLGQLGFIDDTTLLSEQRIKNSVMAAQSLFGLQNDAVLKLTALKAFNVPLAIRIKELSATLNCLRWLSCMKQQGHTILVNIPSANLLLFERNKPVLESRVIVGKRNTPTPTLCSKITEVILYPYWNVPAKIATRELLPEIKKNPGFLEENNYQVLNKTGKRLNPLTIDWVSLSISNFPYIIRQSTGCDNSLGIVKLNFYNPYDVYLHDTPGKNLFSLNRRYFSHGCMRLEKAIEVARFLLKEKSIVIDALVEKGCLKYQSPIAVPAFEPIPVFVLYHTAWLNANGRLVLYEDVYNKFHW